MDETREDCNGVFPIKRVSSVATAIMLLLYFPLGMVVTVLRICLAMNYVCAHTALRFLFSDDSQFLRLLHYLFMVFLGVKVQLSGKVLPSARGVVFNRRSNIDGLILNRMLVACGTNICNLPGFLLPLFRLKSSRDNRHDRLPIIVSLSDGTSKDVSSIAMQKDWITSANKVQLGAVHVRRFLPVSPPASDGKWLYDLLWMFFCPITVYKVFLSNQLLKQSEDESGSEFFSRVSKETLKFFRSTSTALKTQGDTPQHGKSVKKFPQKGQRKLSPKVQGMVEKVLEVTPHVPRDVIVKDLEKTGCADLTLTNIFEGIVKFTPVERDNPPRQMPVLKKQNYINLSMSERKTLFYEQARQRYREKCAD